MDIGVELPVWHLISEVLHLNAYFRIMLFHKRYRVINLRKLHESTAIAWACQSNPRTWDEI